MLALLPDRLMNCGEIGGLGCGDVVEATHRHVGRGAEPAARQCLQRAEGVPMAERRPELLDTLNRLYEGRERAQVGAGARS